MTDKWSDLPSLPEKCGKSNPNLNVKDNKLIVFAGISSRSDMMLLDLNEKKEWKVIKSIPIEDGNNSSLRKVPMLGQMACVELEMTEK